METIHHGKLPNAVSLLILGITSLYLYLSKGLSFYSGGKATKKLKTLAGNFSDA